MRVFVAGGTGVIGQFLVPGLVAAGHQVTASTRSQAKAGLLTDQGATPVIVDGLDREAVLRAVTAAQPEVVRKRQMPVVDGGTGICSFIEVTDAAAATVAAVTRKGCS